MDTNIAAAQNQPRLTKPRRLYLQRADTLLKLADVLMCIRGRTVAQMAARVGFSRATIYRLLQDLRELGVSPVRRTSNGHALYSLPAGSHRIAVRLARVVVHQTGIAGLVKSYDDAIAETEGAR